MDPMAVFMESLGQSVQVAQAIRSAAAQQQQRQTAQREKQFDDQLKMRLAGGTPAAALPENAKGQPTLMTPAGAEPAQPPDDPTHMQTTPWGERWHVPNLEESRAQKAAPLDDTNSVVPAGDLAKGLEAAGWKPGQRIKPSEASSIMGMLEKAQKDDALVHYTTDDDGTLHVFHTDKRTQKTTETSTIPGASAAKAAAAEKPDATQFIPGMFGPGGGPILFNKNQGTTSEVKVPPGSKRELTPGQAEVKARAAEREQDRHDAAAALGEKRRQDEADRQQKIADTFQSKHDKIYGDEQAQWALKQELFDAGHPVDAKGKPMDPATAKIETTDPRTKRPVTLTPSLQKQFRVLQDQAEKKATDLQKQSKAIRQRFKWGEFEEPQTAAQPAQQTAPQSRGKLTDVNIARDYLQRGGGDLVKAQALAKADGWEW